MNFNYLGFVNRLLLMAKKSPITSFTSTLNSDQYRARLAVNDAIQSLSLLLKIKQRQITFTFNTVSGTRTYVIKKRIAYPFYTLRQKTTDQLITPFSTKDYDLFVPDDQSSGEPTKYYMEEYSGAENQPASTGEAVYAVSSSGSDSGTVVIQGYDASNNYVSDEVTLSGTTAKASTSTFVKIESISKVETSGTITFRNNGSTTTYLTLSPKETHARLLTIGLYPIPNAVMTIYGRGWVQMPSLVNEYDLPVGLSSEHINAIMTGSLYHYMKYDPAYKNEGLAGLKQDYYDEVRRITGYDAVDGVNHFMRSAAYARQSVSEFRPLNRRTPLY